MTPAAALRRFMSRNSVEDRAFSRRMTNEAAVCVATIPTGDHWGR